jgi:hypothetical protein
MSGEVFRLVGSNSIYHGTRNLPLVLRAGKLLPPDWGDTAVFFTRSPEVAAYWASMMGQDQFCGGILILNRTSLVQNYRLEPSRYGEDWDHNERKESIWDRSINIRRHLLGVVREADVNALLGAAQTSLFPNGYFDWSERKRKAFWIGEQARIVDAVRNGGQLGVRLQTTKGLTPGGAAISKGLVGRKIGGNVHTPYAPTLLCAR